MSAHCRGCGALVEWVDTARSKVALDPKPVKGGNVEMRAGIAFFVKPEPDVERRQVHRATCPSPEQHPKPRRPYSGPPAPPPPDMGAFIEELRRKPKHRF